MQGRWVEIRGEHIMADHQGQEVMGREILHQEQIIRVARHREPMGQEITGREQTCKIKGDKDRTGTGITTLKTGRRKDNLIKRTNHNIMLLNKGFPELVREALFM